MKLFELLTLKFEDGNWAGDPELGLMDTILEQNPKLIKMLESICSARNMQKTPISRNISSI